MPEPPTLRGGLACVSPSPPGLLVERVADPVQSAQPAVGAPVTGHPSWCRKFGQAYANQLRRRRPRPGDKWHLDEACLTINGERHYLWRAVDQNGNVLDILV
jgi:hypothetical protein